MLYAHLDRYGESGQKAFQNFSAAFVSLYSLSLTVNNPDVYLPYYKRGFLHIIVFASFLVITYFLIHNIILVRIYQIYCVKLKSNAVQRRQKRRRALCLAFEALDETKDGRLPRALVIHVLRRLWPRYDRAKIEAIMRHTHQVRPFLRPRKVVVNRVSYNQATDQVFKPSDLQLWNRCVPCRNWTKSWK